MQVFELPANIRNAPSQSVKFLWTGSFYSWEWQNHKQTNLRLLPGVDATLEAAHGLAFNVNGHCQSLFQVYFGNKDLFEASNEFQNLDPAQRLALLIWYFSSILDDFIAQCKPALALVNPAINKSKYEATEQEKRLQQVTTLHNSIVAYHRALPSTWDFKTKSLKNTIPTEPMTELLAQVYLWVEEQARMKSGQSITSLTYFKNILIKMQDGGLENPGACDSQKQGLCTVIFGTYTTNDKAKPQPLFGSSQVIFEGWLRNYKPFFRAARNGRFTLSNLKTDKELGTKWPGTTWPDIWEDGKSNSAKIMNQTWNSAAEGLRQKGNPVTYLSMQPEVDTLLKAKGSRFAPYSYDKQSGQSWSCFNPAMVAASSSSSPSTAPLFRLIPRCLKCRTIYKYGETLETKSMLNWDSDCNPPTLCAEDIAHAKLRVLGLTP